ncbi:MAG: hypothetical protein GF308_03575 [Candidatus Heimdallarchaeota archaeon]|nr:hypothetical protein [Candidatus Heimdallarchaeota archaeon]
MELKKLEKYINKACDVDHAPCSITLLIDEGLDAFNDVVKVFSAHGFQIDQFVDEYMCVLSRDTEGINEAVKIKSTTLEVQALRETMQEIAEELAPYCRELDND